MEETLKLILQEIGNINHRLDAMDKRFDAIDARFDGIDARLDGIDARFDGIDARLDAMDARLDAMDARLDGMDKRFDGIDARFDTIDARLDAMDKRIDGMERDISDMRQSQILFENTVISEMKAVKDTQAVALDKWKQSMDILDRVEYLLNERDAEKEAANAMLVSHEERITILEQVAV